MRIRRGRSEESVDVDIFAGGLMRGGCRRERCGMLRGRGGRGGGGGAG